jgi:hypothetical protein
MPSKEKPELESILVRARPCLWLKTPWRVCGVQRCLFLTAILVWSIAGAAPRVYAGPLPVSATPNSGSGKSQTFKFTYSHQNGFAAITSVSLIINNVLSANRACYLYYARASNTLWMGEEGGWSGPLILGQSFSPGAPFGILQNKQCTVHGAGSSASGSGNNLVLNLALSFGEFFQGNKNIYLEAYDGIQDSGWVQSGTWRVTGPPTVLGMIVPVAQALARRSAFPTTT